MFKIKLFQGIAIYYTTDSGNFLYFWINKTIEIKMKQGKLLFQQFFQKNTVLPRMREAQG